MRDDPVPEARVELVVTAAADEDRDALASAIEGTDAEVLEQLRFGGLRVACPETAVVDICALDGIDSIETAATRDLAGGDAGEDL